MKCKKCGTEVDDRAKFCPVCGEPMGFDSAPHAPEPPRPNYSSGDYGNSGGYRAPISVRSIPMAIILSIITCGIYGIYWYYTAGGKVGDIQEYDRRPRDSYLGILYLVLDLLGFGIVSMALIQNELNKVAGL